MKKIKYILLALVLGLAGNQLFAMEDPGIADLQLIDDKLDLYKIGPAFSESNKPALSYKEDLKYANPNEEIKFEFRYKQDNELRPIYVRIYDGSSWSEWTKLEVGDRLFSTKMIKRLCYLYNINQPEQCFEFQESEKVYIQLTDGKLEAQTGTTPIGGGSILEFIGRKTPQLRGTIRKSFSGLNMHGNIENEEIRFTGTEISQKPTPSAPPFEVLETLEHGEDPFTSPTVQGLTESQVLAMEAPEEEITMEQIADKAKKEALEALARGDDPFTSPTFQTLLQMQRSQTREGEIGTPTKVLKKIHKYVQSTLPVTDEMKIWLAGFVETQKNALGTTYWQVGISPTGEYIVVQRRDLTADIYTVKNGETTKIENDLGRYVREVDISPTGEYIVVQRRDRTADIYTVKNGEATKVENDLGRDITKVDISPTGEYIVVQRRDLTADIYTIKNGEATKIEGDLEGNIVGVDISPAGEYIVVQREDYTADIYMIKNEEATRIEDDLEDNIKDVDISPTGEYIVVQRRDLTADIYTIKNGEATKIENDLEGDIIKVDISPTGEYIVVNKTNGMDIYTVKNGKATKTESDLGIHARKVDISPTGEYIIVERWQGLAGRTPDIYTVKNGEATKVENDLGRDTTEVYISPTGEYIVVERLDRTADMYTITNGVATKVGNDLGKNISYVIPTEGYIAVVRMDRTVDIYSIDYGLFQGISQDSLNLIAHIYNNRDKKAQLDEEQYVEFMQIPQEIRKSLEPYVEYTKKEALEALERGEDPFTSPTFQTLLQMQRSQIREGKIETPTKIIKKIHKYVQSTLPVTDEMKIWLSGKIKENIILEPYSIIDDVLISSDGKYIGIRVEKWDGKKNNSAHLYKLENNEARPIEYDFGKDIKRVTMSANGKYFGTVSDHNRARLYKLENNKVIPIEYDFGQKITNLSMSADGKYIGTIKSFGKRVSLHKQENDVIMPLFSFRGKGDIINLPINSLRQYFGLPYVGERRSRLYRFGDDRKIKRIPYEFDPGTALTPMSDDGKYFGSLTPVFDQQNGLITKTQIYKLGENYEVIPLDYNFDRLITDLTISSDGKYIGTINDSLTGKIYKLENDNIIPIELEINNVKRLAISQGGRHILALKTNKKGIELYGIDDDAFQRVSQNGLDLIAYIYNNRDKKNRLNDEQYSAFMQLPEKIREKLKPYVEYSSKKIFGIPVWWTQVK